MPVESWEKPKQIIILLTVCLSISACGVSTHGLHNSTKVFTEKRNILVSDWSDPVEMERTWQAALVRIPSPSGIVKSQIKSIDLDALEDIESYPTIIYLHGCAGIWPGTIRRINFLAANGFAVIAPASFARKKYAKSCEPATKRGGLYPAVLTIRQNDAGYAIKKARSLPWVDHQNIFLMGLSEGGITTATFYPGDATQRVNARVIEGWTCKGSYTQTGLRAPETEPVLSLVGESDPWFGYFNKGDCGKYMNKTNGSRSIVFREWPLSGRHELMEASEVKEITLEFLRSHLK